MPKKNQRDIAQQRREQNLNTTVNLFFVYSPLHYICAEHVTEHFENGQTNYLFYIKKLVADLVMKTRCREAVFLPWPRFYPERGLFGQTQRTLKNLEIVESYCKGFDTIRIHTPVIDTEAINYLINHLGNMFPNSSVSVRLIPDGVLNIQRHPLGPFKEIVQYARKLRLLISPRLNYYTLHGDRTGSDTPIVDRIYTLPGFPHEYCRDKVVPLPPFHQPDDSITVAGERRALVIGQPLVQDRRLTPENCTTIRNGIAEFLQRNGVSRVDYKGHPREKGKEFYCEQYQEIFPREPLETFLIHNHYDIVIGIYSTALLTARLILPGQSRVISFGFDKVSYKDRKSKSKVLSVFHKLGIEMMNAGEPGSPAPTS